MDGPASQCYEHGMARPAQLSLPIKPRFTHGGARRGAGRPKGKVPGHTRRPRLSSRHPVHVTLKLQPGLPNLRSKDMFKILRASVKKARAKGFRAAQFSILSNHVHLILEPRSASLAKPLQSLAVSFAKRVNGRLAR